MSMLSDMFSASADHEEKIVYFKIRDNLPSRAVVESIIAYLQENRDCAGYDRILDFRFWNGYLEFPDMAWLAQTYSDLFNGAPPSIKIATLTFDALARARVSTAKPLFSTDDIAAFQTTSQARAWIRGERVQST